MWWRPTRPRLVDRCGFRPRIAVLRSGGDGVPAGFGAPTGDWGDVLRRLGLLHRRGVPPAMGGRARRAWRDPYARAAQAATGNLGAAPDRPEAALARVCGRWICFAAAPRCGGSPLSTCS